MIIDNKTQDEIHDEVFANGVKKGRKEAIDNLIKFTGEIQSRFNMRTHKVTLDLLEFEKLKDRFAINQIDILDKSINLNYKKPIILDDNPLSLACYMEEHPEVDFDIQKDGLTDSGQVSIDMAGQGAKNLCVGASNLPLSDYLTYSERLILDKILSRNRTAIDLFELKSIEADNFAEDLIKEMKEK